jgi:hypothetical protein
MRTLVTLGLGALAMYLLDPEHGRRRRARMREQLAHAKRVVNTRLERAKPLQSPASAQQLGR